MRISRDDYFMTLAFAAAARSTCHLRVGCVIVKDGEVIATGYNGSPQGEPHCCDVGCERVGGYCDTTIHAEVNALLLAGREAKGATIYCTDKPCWHHKCAKLIVRAGIARVNYCRPYEAPRTDGLFARRGIAIRQLAMPKHVEAMLSVLEGRVFVGPDFDDVEVKKI